MTVLRTTNDVLSVAKYLCMISNWSLNNIRLQYLIYISNMIYIGEFDVPLISTSFITSPCGPISQKLYDYVKSFGDKPILLEFNNCTDVQDQESKRIIKMVYDSTKHLTMGHLVGIVMIKDGAWERSLNKGIITTQDIKEEYMSRVKEARSEQKNLDTDYEKKYK